MVHSETTVEDRGGSGHSGADFVWLCAGLVYLSGLVLGLISTFFAFCGVFMLIVGPRQNGIIALILAFLISPFGLPMAAIWLLGKVQALKFAIQDRVYG